MIEMLMLVGAILTAAGCEAGEHDALIKETRHLIVKESPLRVPLGPIKHEHVSRCARVDFFIGDDGKPVNVRIAESSGSRVLDNAAIAAVSDYVFSKGDYHHKRFSIVLRD